MADLKPSGKRKAKTNFTVSVKTPKGKMRKHSEKYYRNHLSLWFHQIKMNHHVFMSINCMRADRSNLKASLSIFNIVSTAECESGDRLQMEEFISWNCKLYEDQRATMMDILPEKGQRRITKVSYRALKTRGKKTCARGLLLHKKILNLFKEKEVNIQNIYTMLLVRNRDSSVCIPTGHGLDDQKGREFESR
jgi:hypothetical protein